MESSYDHSAKLFKALCDPKRLFVLEQLRSGEKCACTLLDTLDIGQSCLSYHMKILCQSGLVDSWQEGKWTHYCLSARGREEAVTLLRQWTTPEAEETPRDTCACAKE